MWQTLSKNPEICGFYWDIFYIIFLRATAFSFRDTEIILQIDVLV
jgi:hypothetical protein